MLCQNHSDSRNISCNAYCLQIQCLVPEKDFDKVSQMLHNVVKTFVTRHLSKSPDGKSRSRAGRSLLVPPHSGTKAGRGIHPSPALLHYTTTMAWQHCKHPDEQNNTGVPLEKSAEPNKFTFMFQVISTTKGTEIISAPKLNGNAFTFQKRLTNVRSTEFCCVAFSVFNQLISLFTSMWRTFLLLSSTDLETKGSFKMK